MSINVRYFASLRERMGRPGQALEIATPCRVADVWALASGGAEWSSNMLCAVNLDQSAPGDVVHDGDEVAFFPPVTGG